MIAMMLWASGCDRFGHDVIPVEVDPSGDAPTISWDLGKVHEVEVTLCDNPVCECGKFGAAGFGGLRVWSVGFDEDASLGAAAASEPAIASPIGYGQTDVPGDERHEAAIPLEPGETYGVSVSLLEPCDPPDPNSSCSAADGCSTFSAD